MSPFIASPPLILANCTGHKSKISRDFFSPHSLNLITPNISSLQLQNPKKLTTEIFLFLKLQIIPISSLLSLSAVFTEQI